MNFGLARIRPAGLVGVERVPDVTARSPEEAMEREGQELLKRVQPRDRVVLLREDGPEYNSPAFASLLSKEMGRTAGRLLPGRAALPRLLHPSGDGVSSLNSSQIMG